MVEIEGVADPPTACNISAADSMVVKTATERVTRMRREALEKLLAGHPPECVECNKYLNCELQSIKQFMGFSDTPGSAGLFVGTPVNNHNPLFLHDPVRCIRCERCVRACNELRGVGILKVIEENGPRRVGIPEGVSLAEAGCRFCGACVEVCPTGALRDKPELMEGKKRKEALVPCRYACPSQIDVPRYVRLISQGKYAEAAAVIREKVPFPLVLGYICNHICEKVCRRGQINDPISIRDLKRFSAEQDSERLWERNARRKPSTDNRVAVVGSGPAGLTAAFYLAKLGHDVTVFEALPLAGGMMRYGIPEYRLPRSVLDSEIEEIEKFSIKIKTGTRVESLDALRYEEGFDAVLLAVGAHKGQKLAIPGADLSDVLVGLDFLREINLGKRAKIGSQIVILGGGNVAVDCARVARRLSAKEVSIVCLESRREMPADFEEIEESEREGIVIHPTLSAVRIIGADGTVAGVECLTVSSFEFDEKGSAHIETEEGTRQILPADTVIFAVGQRTDLPDNFKLDLNERGRLEVDPYTLETTMEGVFAAGDSVNGTTSVIQAVACGRNGAIAIDKYLGGSGDIDETLATPDQPVSCFGPCAGFAEMKRSEDVSGIQVLEARTAVAEASRCLRCDLRLKITPVKFWGDY